MPGTMTVSLRINADGSAAITSLKQVEGAVTGLGKAGTQSASGIKQTETALDGVAKRSHEASYGVSNLTKSLQGMAITAGAAVSVAALARSFIQANIESQRLSKGLEAITGSTGAGAAELRYLQETADKLGLSLAAVSPAFISLSAATRGTVLEGQATKDIFEAVSLAMAKLGKSSADTQGALLAIEQMVSKGVVSAEELRGQLGERLPGAFRLAAQAMGVSEQELGKMLEKGDVLAADLIPRLVQWLNKLFNDGKEIGGLEAGWNLLVNALDRAWVSTDKLINASGLLSDAMRIAADVLNSYANALEAISNYNAGLGFRTFADDVAKFGVTLQASNQALKDYVAAREHADNVKNFTAFGVADDAAANADAALKKFQELRVTAYELKKALDEADAAKQRQAQSLAVSVGDDAIRLYRAHEAAVKANGEALDGLNGKYDKSIARAAEYKKMEEAVAEAVKLGTMTKEEGKAALEKFAAAQDKAAEAAGRHAGALSQEAQTVAAMEQKYGLMKGQLDAIWKLESNRGAGAGVESSRWVADLAAGSGHMTKIVGEFQMAEGTAKSLGADMRTFSGQADAAAKYLAQAAAKGKTLWEQFAYYHGGPNEAAWGEKTRAYADAAVKIVADATGTMQDLGQNTGKVITDTLNQAIRTVESLVQRYLPARYAAEEYAKAQQALAIASDAAGLSQEEQATILRGLQNDLQNSKTKATETADAWAEVWKNTVKRIDDAFAGMWENLITGTGSTLDNLKQMLGKWLAEVAHALLTKPLVVALTTSLTGTAGAAGTATGAATQAASGLSGWSNVTSLFSTAWSLGSTFLEGVAAGFSSMFSGTAGTALSFAWAGATSGTASGMAAGLGVAMPYIAPLLAIAGFAISKFFADQEPRYGAWSATVGNNPRGLEDWENGPDNYARGGFGLTFGLSDNGSKNMDASEMKDQFNAFAQITQMLADFFGKSLSAKIQAGLESAAFANWTQDGVMRLANNEDMASAFKGIIDMIAEQAAVTGEHIGVAFEYALGDLTGTAEEMATQVQVAMQAAAAYTLVAESWNTHIGAALGLTGDFGADIRTLGGYVSAFANDGENAAQTLARLVAQTQALQFAAEITSTSLAGLVGSGLMQLGEDLAAAFGGIDIASAALSFYAQNFQTAGENYARQARAALEQIERVWQKVSLGDGSKVGIAIPATREEFNNLVNSLDLTSEAGRTLFAQLMQLAPAFDVVFDGLEAFNNWLRPQDQQNAALKQMTDLFQGWGLTLPKTREELERLVASGALTTEQMAILGNHLDALNILFAELSQRASLLDFAELLDPTNNTSADRIRQGEDALRRAGYKGDLRDQKGIADFLRALSAMDDAGGQAGRELLEFLQTFREVFDALAAAAQQNADLQIRLATARGDDALALKLQREQELKGALDATNRALLEQIYALEDAKAAMDKAYAALEKAVAEERKQVEKTYQARVDAINKEREAINKQLSQAQTALSKITGVVDSIQSALEKFRDTATDNAIAIAAARAQLAAWAAHGILPSQERFDQVMGSLNRDDRGNYANATAWRVSQQSIYANLLELEKQGLKQKTDAEKQIEALEKQLTALDKQLEQANDWRDKELERLDGILEDAKKRMEIALGTYVEIQSIDDAMAQLNKSIDDFLKLKNPPAPTLIPTRPLEGSLTPINDPFYNRDAKTEQQAQSFEDLKTEVVALRQELVKVGVAQAVTLSALDARLTAWDLDGSPPWRDDGTGQAATLLKVS